ncbi:hypothetical protein GGX14DRAFT_567987 [Mycena pura]|uniref:F-box domain-containing protein n=1 Tax=Mycena pura TaxID=153505 RepID=A0AAD6VH43_9AGAR|nr:hypothetical protein GGX14DRAFT_567987 [Mycena pura]
MNHTPRAAIETLPDEILAGILKLVADSPVPAYHRTLPFPVAAGRVSRRLRAVVHASPELWNTIRLSHHSHSWHWATVFVKRSGSYPLDISINLEAYIFCKEQRYFRDAPIPIHQAFAIVGPHINRWRTIALRCLRLCVRTPGRPLSLVDHYSWNEVKVLPPFAKLFGGPAFCSLRANTRIHLTNLVALRAVNSLDIDFGDYRPHEFCQIFGPSSPLKTLVIRRFSPESLPVAQHIEASTVISLAVSFSGPFYSFETLTDMFTFPNLETLEIVGGFTVQFCNYSGVTVPEEWEAPLFPHLRTLRLEDLGFSLCGLSHIQSFSRGITDIELVNTTGNHCISEQYSGGCIWPALRALTLDLTLETCAEEVAESRWLGPFLAKRASLGADRCILKLKLSPWVAHIALPAEFHPEIHWLCDGPPPGLMDGNTGHDFYIDDYTMRTQDFEPVNPPYPPKCCDDFDHYSSYAIDVDEHLRQVDNEIADTFKVTCELVRTKGVWRELRKKMRRGFKAERKFKMGRKRGWRDLMEDFCLMTRLSN